MNEQAILSTLCYLEKDGMYLMLHRVSKKDDVNSGKWIGAGGKIKPGEAPEECLIREVFEETGFRLSSAVFRGVITFEYAGKAPEYIFAYTSADFDGDTSVVPTCDEGVFRWVPIEEIDELELWEGDRLMLPLLRDPDAGTFSLKFRYDASDSLIEAIAF